MRSSIPYSCNNLIAHFCCCFNYVWKTIVDRIRLRLIDTTFLFFHVSNNSSVIDAHIQYTYYTMVRMRCMGVMWWSTIKTNNHCLSSVGDMRVCATMSIYIWTKNHVAQNQTIFITSVHRIIIQLFISSIHQLAKWCFKYTKSNVRYMQLHVGGNAEQLKMNYVRVSGQIFINIIFITENDIWELCTF